MLNLATWFSPSLQTFARSAGRSAVISAAYRACAKLIDERLGKCADFRPKGVHGLAANICVGIPNGDIGKIWNDAESAEKRANSTVARELMLPLSHEWNDDERRECVRAIAQMLRDDYGVAVMASIHRPDVLSPNDHVHMMFTTRAVDDAGIFGKKTRVLDDAKSGEVKKLREKICQIVNAYAVKAGSNWYVYAGKFIDVMPDHIPTHHISPIHGERQKEFIERNRKEVRDARHELSKIRVQVRNTEKKIERLQMEKTSPEWGQDEAPTLASANEGGRVETEAKEVLKRISMPADALDAMDRRLKADKFLPKFLKRLALEKSDLERLEREKPNFIVRYFTKYHMRVQLAQKKLRKTRAAIQRLESTVNNPQFKSLCDEYDRIIAHNVKVGAQEQLERKMYAAEIAQAEAHAKMVARTKFEMLQKQEAVRASVDRSVIAQEERQAVFSVSDDGYGM